MSTPIMSAGPHIRSTNSSRRIMLDVIIALLPAAIASVILFGFKALAMIVTCVAAAVASEYLFNVVTKREQTVGDLSAVLTGLLLALNLSTNTALWECAVGSIFAIVLVKCMFGGIGKNFANPAITGRVFMLLAFSSVAGGAMPRMVDAVSGATPLEVLGGLDLASLDFSAMPTLGNMLLGVRGGAIGEGCIIALVIGFVYLLVRRVIKWHVPVIFIGTVFLCYIIATGNLMFSVYEVLSGGLFIGAIFMATDYVTTPITVKGRALFALGCGLITFIIRYFCAYPEGVSFSILIMNLLAPALEKITPNKPLGGTKK